jgi:hypothetical protein
MALDKSKLVEFLKILDQKTTKRITLIAAGGTAMTLLNIKKSTRDIDFTAPTEDYSEFRKILNKTPHGFVIHLWPDGTVFSQFLPDDYEDKSVTITQLNHITLKALNPIDIVVTKIGRLDPRDLEDIEDCIRKKQLSKNQIKERAEKIQYVGNEETYKTNLKHVLTKFYPNP